MIPTRQSLLFTGNERPLEYYL
ncbi:hypothetical protein NUU61_007007 [Penicillium alfredii]|uniref:Uncharacterized protein n=1 Tax=Penicillium alfredii TaxID=1506179 RepID=A0A9W9F251_9EURO|nr:hypothetical protein NUU61_007007 [Penicillium alfredii]